MKFKRSSLKLKNAMSYVYKLKIRYTCANKLGSEIKIPGIYTEDGILLSHIRYLASNAFKSQSWMERSAFSMILLIKFMIANQGAFNSGKKLLCAFTHSLTIGTVNPETGEDPSQLFWMPRKLEDANQILAHITKYTDYLANQDGYENSLINPFRTANSTEQRLNWCSYYHKQAHVFLNHLSKSIDTKNIFLVRTIRARANSKIDTELVVRFPESKIEDFFNHGLIKPFTSENTNFVERFDFKNQAITILLHFGGLRKSEALQLYLTDIHIDNVRNESVVRVYHPADGESPDKRYKTRREYLQKQFFLKPRMDYSKSERQHCGWKDPLLTDRRGFFQVIFAPPSKAKDFLEVWANYLKYQRVDPPEDFNHPYAFTNNCGHPETIKNFQRLHANAVRRIGLESSKYLGTTEHGHRHSYGYRLSEYGFSQIEIQKCMHHKSHDSCLVYLKPCIQDIRDKMEATI